MGTQLPTNFLGPGSVIQVVSTVSTAIASTSNPMIFGPLDYTNTQGAEFMALSITPKFATSTIIVQVVAVTSTTTSGTGVGLALFQDAGTIAVAASVPYPDSGGASGSGTPMVYVATAGSTNLTTFHFRAGPSSGAMYLNSYSSNGLSGSSVKSSMIITEVAA